MPSVFLSLGSNQQREHYIRAGLDALHVAFGAMKVSPVYESEAVGFKGRPFYNLVVEIQTSLSVGELSRCLKAMEDSHGRDRAAAKFSPRTLDIDILLYDQEVGIIEGVDLPRAEILENAFVLRPLSDLAPEEFHPEQKRSYLDLWRNYRIPQKLWPIEFVWHAPT